MSLDATVGGVAANSFTTVAEANTYHKETRLFNDEWLDEGTGTKEKALKWATRLLDNLPWLGKATDFQVQRLRWPRYDVFDREVDYWDGDEIPAFLKEATAELAWLLIIKDSTREDDTKGFHMIKVGPITLQINSTDRSQDIYDSVMSMVNPYIEHGVRMERG